MRAVSLYFSFVVVTLQTFEFDEWGNPKIEEFYHYMLSYSPYDQIKAQVCSVCRFKRARTVLR